MTAGFTKSSVSAYRSNTGTFELLARSTGSSDLINAFMPSGKPYYDTAAFSLGCGWHRPRPHGCPQQKPTRPRRVVSPLAAAEAAVARVHLGGGGVVAQLGEAAAHVSSVLVHAEDLWHHQQHRVLARRGGYRAVGRNLAVSQGNAEFAGHQAQAVGAEGLRQHRAGGHPKTAV